MALTDKLTAIADAIRAKTGGTELLTLDQMAAAISGISGGGTVETGSFVVDDTQSLIIPCAFEPDIILIERDEAFNAGSDVASIFNITFIKSWLYTGRYIANTTSTSLTDGRRDWEIVGYGSSNLSYADGSLSGIPRLQGRKLKDGYTYNYILGRCGF